MDIGRTPNIWGVCRVARNAPPGDLLLHRFPPLFPALTKDEVYALGGTQNGIAQSAQNLKFTADSNIPFYVCFRARMKPTLLQ
jgi:hypothetical protein